MFENAASEQLKLSVKKQIEKMLKEKGDSEKPFFSLSGLTVKIRKGHTCSRRWYIHFLSNMEKSMRSVIDTNNLLKKNNNNNSNGDDNNNNNKNNYNNNNNNKKNNNNNNSNSNNNNYNNDNNDIENKISNKNNENEKEFQQSIDNKNDNEKVKVTEQVKKSYLLPAIKSENIFLFEKTEEKQVKDYMTKFSFLQYLPLEIDIVGG
jgi:DNA mismatch repair ATPase MutL